MTGNHSSSLWFVHRARALDAAIPGACRRGGPERDRFEAEAVDVPRMRASAEQAAVCRRFGAAVDVPSPESRLGIALNCRDAGVWPINGLRHPPRGPTNGWYLWRGEELRQDDDFFRPLHTVHLADWCPDVVPYLALPPGWRVLIAPGHEDVWYDESLLLV